MSSVRPQPGARPDAQADQHQLTAFSQTQAGGATVRLDGHYPRAALIARAWNLISRTFHWLAGSFIFCNASVFREIGGFNNELFASEEIDLSRRLKKAARSSHRRIVVLSTHPIVTSARKLRLYSPKEHVAFLIKTVLRLGRTLTDREACHTWYDGRR